MEVLDDNTLDDLEKRIDEVRISYEQYFLGTRKREPEQQKSSVQYVIRRLANQHSNNTKIKFRFAQLTARFNAYSQYWVRIINQMEAGTYKRDKFKMELRAKAIQKAVNEGKLPADPAAKPAPEPEPVSEEESRIDKLYGDFIEARKQLNQATDTITREKLAATIRGQLPKLQEKYKGKTIEFKVVVENGQAKLKAQPK